MCDLKPLEVKKIEGRKVILENGIEAVYDNIIGKIEPGDYVLVYGNLVVEKVEKTSEPLTS